MSAAPLETVEGLLAHLEVLDIDVCLNTSGDGLKLSGRARPPAEVVSAVQKLKPALLAYLRGENSNLSNSIGLPEGQQDAGPMAAASQPSSSPGLPDWAEEAAKPGRCGSCARSRPAPDWGRLMVRCTCPADAWWPASPPLACHVGARCGAYLEEGAEVGKGYRPKADRPTWPQEPVQVVSSWEDLPSASF